MHLGLIAVSFEIALAVIFPPCLRRSPRTRESVSELGELPFPFVQSVSANAEGTGDCSPRFTFVSERYSEATEARMVGLWPTYLDASRSFAAVPNGL
jgi:hypothetical protein